MQFDTALNFIWLALGVFAVIATLRARATSSGVQGPAWLHICGVALIIAALFPYVSASDDVLRIDHFHVEAASVSPHLASGDSTDKGKERAPDELMRLYEIMDSPLLSAAQGVAFSFVFISLVITLTLRSVFRNLSLLGGRSPPSCELSLSANCF